MKTWTSSLRHVAVLGVIGIAFLFGATMAANAQGYGHVDRHAVRDQQRAVRHQIRDQQQNRHAYYGNNSYYGNNGYNNNGYYGNNGYNNNGYYGNNGYNNNSYYGNNGYYGGYNSRYSVPHRDSRNGLKRGLHHLLGGH